MLEKKVKKRTSELEEINLRLKTKQQKINNQNEEIVTQKNHLAEVNQKLLEQHQQIIKQNKELHYHRNSLEDLVEERTRELIEAKEKAEESDKLKSAFMANMSHEIRTPMNAIVGFTSLLKDEGLPEKEQKEIINIVINNSESLLVLINDILDLSYIQAGQLQLKFAKHNIKDLLKEIHTEYSLEASEKGLNFKLIDNLVEDNTGIQVDLIRMKQVWNNLIGNAIKFTKNGEITMGVKSIQQDDIIFFVSDTGIGIDPKIGNKIFERFRKVEANESQKILYRGTGLGLAICRSIVQLWNGRIWYDSIPGKGTNFYFTYPVNFIYNTDSKNTSIIPKITENKIPTLDNKTILIAEDEVTNFKVLSVFFNKTNANIVWVKNGEEAINFVKNNKKVDLVLMDIKMPKLDGCEAMKAIKQFNPSLKIIAQTAYAQIDKKDEYIADGFDDFIIKPFKQGDLFAMVKKYI